MIVHCCVCAQSAGILLYRVCSCTVNIPYDFVSSYLALECCIELVLGLQECTVLQSLQGQAPHVSGFSQKNLLGTGRHIQGICDQCAALQGEQGHHATPSRACGDRWKKAKLWVVDSASPGFSKLSPPPIGSLSLRATELLLHKEGYYCMQHDYYGASQMMGALLGP